MNLMVLTEADRRDGDRFLLNDHRAEHIRSILKLSEGDRLEVGLLDGPIGTGVVESISPDGVTVRTESLTAPAELSPTVDLVCALPRPPTLKKILQTSATMGVRRLYFVRANRVEKSYFQSPLLRPENQRRHLIDGLSQGKLTRLPVVSIHDRFRAFFEDVLPAAIAGENHHDMKPLLLLPDQTAKDSLLDLCRHDTRPPWFIAAIGPEGGWVPFEIELMERLGFRRFRLGRFVLRVETATAALLAQLELLRMR